MRLDEVVFFIHASPPLRQSDRFNLSMRRDELTLTSGHLGHSCCQTYELPRHGTNTSHYAPGGSQLSRRFSGTLNASRRSFITRNWPRPAGFRIVNVC